MLGYICGTWLAGAFLALALARAAGQADAQIEAIIENLWRPPM